MRPGELKVVMLKVQDDHKQTHYSSGDIDGHFDRIGGGVPKTPPLFEARVINLGVNQLTIDPSRICKTRPTAPSMAKLLPQPDVTNWHVRQQKPWRQRGVALPSK